MFELKKIREIKEDIKKLIEEQKLDDAKSLIGNYKSMIDFDLEIENMSAIIEFYKGNLKESEKKLLNIYEKFEFNFDVNYNLGIVYMYMEQYKKATKYYIRCMCIDGNKIDLVMPEIESMINQNKLLSSELKELKEVEIKIFKNYQKQFPMGQFKTNYIEDKLVIDNKCYYTGIYDHYFAERDNILTQYQDNLSDMYKFEVFKGEICKEFKFATKYKTIIPIMIKSPNTKVKVKAFDKVIALNNMICDRYYYYMFNKEENIKIFCDEGRFIVGEPIEITCNHEKPKLMLNIFVDGLSQEFLETNEFSEVMPNAYKFFKEGTICSNAHVSGEWTYVSLASFFSGMYTTNHKVYHPDYSTFSLYDKELYSEVIKRNGYFTAKIDGDWRSTPTVGYVKGVDRYVYQPTIRGMFTDEVISETIEHLEAFKEKNNFVWIYSHELHDVADELEGRLSVQVQQEIETRSFNKTTESSVRKTYDVKKILKYKTQLKRIDTYLGTLFNYIKDNYTEKEYIISMFADHGQGYFVKDKFLDDGRTKVAMMFRGKNIPKGICTEMVQGLDLFPIILNAAEIKDVDLKDGNVPKYFGGEKERKFTYTESIFPGSPYRATINDLEHKFFFETKENCEIDGRFKIDEYTVELTNKHTNKDETNIHKEKVEEYLQTIFQHIKEYIII